METRSLCVLFRTLGLRVTETRFKLTCQKENILVCITFQIGQVERTSLGLIHHGSLSVSEGFMVPVGSEKGCRLSWG